MSERRHKSLTAYRGTHATRVAKHSPPPRDTNELGRLGEDFPAQSPGQYLLFTLFFVRRLCFKLTLVVSTCSHCRNGDFTITLVRLPLVCLSSKDSERTPPSGRVACPALPVEDQQRGQQAAVDASLGCVDSLTVVEKAVRTAIRSCIS